MTRPPWPGLAVVLVALGGCHFEPDLSRFAPCAEDGTCPAGTTCLPEARRCLPDCGERGACPPETPSSQQDGGVLSDGGTDAGVPDAGPALAPRVAGPGTLADALLAEAYGEQLSALGGTPPYRFTLEPGSQLPPGLGLREDGQVTGTPSQAGTTGFTVRVTDSATPAQAATRPLSMQVSTLSPTLTMTTRAVPDGRAGQPYRYELRAAGHTGALTWTLTAGTLPEGLRLETSAGVLSGTPTQPGVRTFTLSVADSLRGVERTLSLTVD